MLLRKRAWDILREDFITMTEDGSVLDAMRGMAGQGGGCLAVVVTGPDGSYKGAITSWNIVQFVSAALAGSNALKEVDENGVEGSVGVHCKKCGTTGVGELISGKTPVIPPSEPFLGVMNAMLKSKQRIAVVAEGPKVMGVISLSDVFAELAQGMVPEE